MAAYLHSFWQEEDGQDLIEYSLLITFIAIACAAIVGAGRPAVNSIWIGANNQIANASSVARGS
jgi:Flp pilus assembly pilin Flp